MLEGVLELAVSPDRAQTGCREAFADLGWDIPRDQPGQVNAREDITRLGCHQSPAETSVRIEESDAGCALTIATKVPGFGSISSSHARGRQAAIVRHVHDRATSAPLETRPRASSAND